MLYVAVSYYLGISLTRRVELILFGSLSIIIMVQQVMQRSAGQQKITQQWCGVGGCKHRNLNALRIQSTIHDSTRLNMVTPRYGRLVLPLIDLVVFR